MLNSDDENVASILRASSSDWMSSTRPQVQGVLVALVQLWFSEVFFIVPVAHVQFAHSARPAVCAQHLSRASRLHVWPYVHHEKFINSVPHPGHDQTQQTRNQARHPPVGLTSHADCIR